MAQADIAPPGSGRLELLSRLLERHEGFAEAVASLASGRAATIDGVWGSSCALVAAELARRSPGPLVVVAPQAADIDELADELELFSGVRPVRFPAWESDASERIAYDESYADRLRLVKALAAGEAPPLVVTSIQSLMQPVAARATLAAGTRTLRVGQTLDLPELLRWLVERGFHGTTAVELPGEFSQRGGILDLFAPDWFEPVRVELFDDVIESIRRFDIGTQRSLGSLEAVELTMIDAGSTSRDDLTGYLPPQTWFLLLELMDIEEQGRQFVARQEQPQAVHHVADVLQRIYRFATATAAGVSGGSYETTCHLKIESVERFSGDIRKVRDELDAAGAGHDVYVVVQNEAEAKRLEEVFATTRLAGEGKLHYPVGRIRSGFRLVSEQIVVVSGGELFQRTDLARTTRRHMGRVLDSFLELREGDLVVHLAHGIGRYRGMKLLEQDGRSEEHLQIEFHGGTRVFVPASKIELVQKYVGTGKARPTLARIGGKSWIKQKQAAAEAVTDLAVEMLQMQAARKARPGFAFPRDTDWQQEFDASFPYVETPDQLDAIESIKGDMQRSRPMDRLLCGDVGFGKTEVAMRAAFKAVDAGYQVAVLVPTTVLAEQHLRTFTGRLAEFPFAIAALSRFATTGQQKKIVAQIEAGAVDIVIGTHRLASSDVRFHNLGLLVIDEEQRFGVAVKERLKALRQSVDVLTMTATPIPRTLHMSLLGLRDISNLESPPADRLAVETRVTRFNPELVRHAMLRELNRGGQAFFVHNRVADIRAVAERLGRIVPEARIGIGHGQMPEGELEQVMIDFVNHQYDILLATTIIESGLDIPNANTIFIDEADRYGLADLHQLRGRVGRYKHRAYCYLLLEPGKHLSTVSAKRLRAIEEFSDMGAGFAIAMRDLEIRGAGNILGTQQSGHIATVGYELYCELLEAAVRRLTHLPPREVVDVNVDLPGEGYLPGKYVADQRIRIDLYRRLARVASDQELRDFAAELSDRFGPPPPAVQSMLSLAELRIAAARWKIDTVHREDDYLVFRYTDPRRIAELKAASGGRLRIADGRSAYLPIGKGVMDGATLLDLAKSLLQPA